MVGQNGKSEEVRNPEFDVEYYEIKIFTKLDLELKKYWQELEKSSYCYCFQSYEWFENCVNYMKFNNQNYSLCIVVVKYKSKVICIFPFEIVRKFNLKILKWAGDKQSDYCSPILSKDYNFDNNSAIRLWCNFFTKETIKKRNLVNGLTVSLDTNDWLSWLNKEAYK